MKHIMTIDDALLQADGVTDWNRSPPAQARADALRVLAAEVRRLRAEGAESDRPLVAAAEALLGCIEYHDGIGWDPRARQDVTELASALRAEVAVAKVVEPVLRNAKRFEFYGIDPGFDQDATALERFAPATSELKPEPCSVCEGGTIDSYPYPRCYSCLGTGWRGRS